MKVFNSRKVIFKKAEKLELNPIGRYQMVIKYISINDKNYLL